jgi:hypothetical protein
MSELGLRASLQGSPAPLPPTTIAAPATTAQPAPVVPETAPPDSFAELPGIESALAALNANAHADALVYLDQARILLSGVIEKLEESMRLETTARKVADDLEVVKTCLGNGTSIIGADRTTPRRLSDALTEAAWADFKKPVEGSPKSLKFNLPLVVSTLVKVDRAIAHLHRLEPGPVWHSNLDVAGRALESGLNALKHVPNKRRRSYREGAEIRAALHVAHAQARIEQIADELDEAKAGSGSSLRHHAKKLDGVTQQLLRGETRSNKNERPTTSVENAKVDVKYAEQRLAAHSGTHAATWPTSLGNADLKHPKFGWSPLELGMHSYRGKNERMNALYQHARAAESFSFDEAIRILSSLPEDSGAGFNPGTKTELALHKHLMNEHGLGKWSAQDFEACDRETIAYVLSKLEPISPTESEKLSTLANSVVAKTRNFTSFKAEYRGDWPDLIRILVDQAVTK